MKFFNAARNRRIESIANIVIILSGLVLCIRFIRPDLLSFNRQDTSIRVGAKLDLPGVDWSSHDQTLVLVLQEGCRYCAESAPFYKRLALETEQSTRVHLVALLRQGPEDSKRYLESLGVPIRDIRQAKLSSLKISATPTLLLLDREGVVKDVWVGKLSDRGEKEVLRKIAG